MKIIMVIMALILTFFLANSIHRAIIYKGRERLIQKSLDSLFRNIDSIQDAVKLGKMPFIIEDAEYHKMNNQITNINMVERWEHFPNLFEFWKITD